MTPEKIFNSIITDYLAKIAKYELDLERLMNLDVPSKKKISKIKKCFSKLNEEKVNLEKFKDMVKTD